MLSEPNSSVDKEMTDVLQALVDKLAAAGATVDDAARPDVDWYRAHELYILLLRAATSARMDPDMIEAQKAEAATLDPSDNSYYARMLRANTMSHPEWLRLNNERAHLRRRWAEFFQDYDLLLCPAAASAAQPHDHEGERWTRTVTVNNEQVLTTDQLFWAGISGVVYLPSNVAPAGFTRSNLPVGIQIIGPNYGAHTCIEFARLIEENFGGFVPPPGYEQTLLVCDIFCRQMSPARALLLLLEVMRGEADRARGDQEHAGELPGETEIEDHRRADAVQIERDGLSGFGGDFLFDQFCQAAVRAEAAFLAGDRKHLRRARIGAMQRNPVAGHPALARDDLHCQALQVVVRRTAVETADRLRQDFRQLLTGTAHGVAEGHDAARHRRLDRGAVGGVAARDH